MQASFRAEAEMFTDGACRGNPGPGGWGVLMRAEGREKTLQGADAATTNNRMELTAAIEGLRALKRHCRIVLYTDSVYVRSGITEWLQRWRMRGWRTAARKPVKNSDLWRELDAQAQRHEIDWRWVRGHSGNPGNERADALANEAIDAMMARLKRDGRVLP